MILSEFPRRIAVAAVALLAGVGLLAGCDAGSGGDAASTPAAEQQNFKWKMVTTWPKNLPALGTAPERFARLVDEMSNGRLKIKVYGAGELVPAFGVFDAVSSGTAEMGHGAAYYWRGKRPIAAVFATVPFGMNAQETNAWLHYGGGLQLWQELYAPFGLRPMACGNSGTQMAGWFNREVNSVADLKGLKMRIPGFGGEVFQRAGGTPVTIPGGEIFTSMQTGAIDATEWVGPYNDLAFGLHTVGKFYYYPGWHEPGPTLECLVNEEAFASLPSDLQAIVKVAARAINADMLDDFTAHNKDALATLVNDHQVQLRQLPPDVLARFRELTDQVLDDTAGDDELALRILASYRKFAKDVAAYHDISEEAYLRVR